MRPKTLQDIERFVKRSLDEDLESQRQDRLEGFANFLTLIATFEDMLKKSQDIGQVEPKAAIYALGIKPPRHFGVLPLHQHGALAS